MFIDHRRIKSGTALAVRCSASNRLEESQALLRTVQVQKRWLPNEHGTPKRSAKTLQVAKTISIALLRSEAPQANTTARWY